MNDRSHSGYIIGQLGAESEVGMLDNYLIELLRGWNATDSVFEIYDVRKIEFSDGDSATLLMIDCLNALKESKRHVGAWRPLWPSMNWSAWEEHLVSYPFLGEFQKYGRGAMHQTDETGVRRIKPMHKEDPLRPPPNSKSVLKPSGSYSPVRDVSKWHRVTSKWDYRKTLDAVLELEEQDLLAGRWTFRAAADTMAKRLRWPVLYFSSESDAVAVKLRLA